MPCRPVNWSGIDRTIALMPFTASHVAAVLPFVRTPLVPSALVVGSMVPDLTMFYRLHIYTETHSVLGVFVFNAAIGFGALALWHLLLAEPLYTVAPHAVRRRLPAPDPASLLRRAGWPRRLLLTYASLVVGAGTHVSWDAFTHPGRWGSQHIDWFATWHGPLPGTSWAQYASTVLGGVAVAGWLALWWRRSGVSHPPQPTESGPQFASLVLLIPPLIGIIVGFAVAFPLVVSSSPQLHWAAFVAVTYGIGTAGTTLLLLAVGWHLRRRFDSCLGHHSSQVTRPMV